MSWESAAGLFGVPVRELLRVALAALDDVASWQNPDGGFPETYAGDRSGCWTTAEVYGALAMLPRLSDTLNLALESSERFLEAALERSQAGLPYTEPECGRPVAVVDATAAFLLGAGARGRESSMIERARSWLREARLPDGGWGVCAGGPGVRTYSTAYSILALSGTCDVTPDQARLRSLQLETGAWPFRPGGPPSRLGTSLALASLRGALPPDSEARARRWLMAELVSPRFDEEDSFFTAEGYKLSFVYAPRLACLATLLDLSIDGGAVTEETRVVVLDLARHILQVRETRRPCPDFPEVRAWHFIELAWGLAALHRVVATAPARLREELEAVAATAWEAARRAWCATALPWPLRRQSVIAASPRSRSAAVVRAVATHLEQLLAFVELALIVGLRRLPGGAEAVMEHLSRGRRGLMDVARVRRSFQRALGRAVPDASLALPVRLAAELGPVLSSDGLQSLRDARNDEAHGRPITDPRQIEELRTAWVGLIEALPGLCAVDLAVIDKLGHDAATTLHVYRFTDLARREERGVVFSAESLETGLWLGDEELTYVYLRGGASPLSAGPFALSAHCRGCGTERLFLYRGWDPDSSTLTLDCTEGCRTRIELPVTAETLTGQRA